MFPSHPSAPDTPAGARQAGCHAVLLVDDDARFEAQARQRTVVVDAQDEAVVRGSVELLRRALENVVRNAIKYSFEGGTVRLAVRRNAAARSDVISVRDAGPGPGGLRVEIELPLAAA